MKTNISSKSRTAALLFVLFLGIWGAHRFYTGKIGSAIAMLLLSLTMVGIVITSIWSLIDFFMIVTGSFKDKEGNIIKNW